MAYIIKVTEANASDKKNRFLLFHIAKSVGGFRASAVNGDSSTYLYPVDGDILFPDARNIAEMLEKAKAEYVRNPEKEITGEDKDLNCYDFAVTEIVDGAASIEVPNSRDIQPITMFRRASYDNRDTVLARLRAQVHRQLANGELVVKTDE